jgi:hypothetical protein
MADTKLVDMEVLDVVYRAAQERLKIVRATERDTLGVATTNMATIGRAAIANWRPPRQARDSTGRAMRHGMQVRPFRFSMPRESYEETKQRIHAAGQSVAGVVQDGLAKFARTGTY